MENVFNLGARFQRYFLFDLIIYVPVNNFQLCQDGSSWVEPVHCTKQGFSNSYTMACPSACGDNPQVLANRFSYVQLNKHGITIL